ncbi:hypothetical protein CkaCkLH20_10405 [Colletotrichum karsti]|uniref:Uncharacterized protein n=1 Tax=Colletotrichum karsti TaxID=1095194 RepID=A0A9P6LG20_9PEZI|nr:uncharacterized protein CkaCkLH20_10405 [Colletotrichum karsti]KAF9872068.1 hypothetical protein CkaCkLH20_10405 [Colletotrichum karsti]
MAETAAERKSRPMSASDRQSASTKESASDQRSATQSAPTSDAPEQTPTNSVPTVSQSDTASVISDTKTIETPARLTLNPTETAKDAKSQDTSTARVPKPESKDNSFSVRQVVVGNYVPIITARAFVMALNVAYPRIAALEPLRQLMTNAGASGAALAGSAITLAPIAGSLFLVDFGSAVAVEAVTPDAWWCGIPATSTDLTPCPPRLSRNPWAMNTLTAGLALISVALAYAIGLWFKTPSRINVDATTISGVAAVMGHPQIESDFGMIPKDMTQTELALYLKDKKFNLGTFPSRNGEKYGLVPAAVSADSPGLMHRLESTAVERKASLTLDTPWTHIRFLTDLIFVVFHLALLGFSVAALTHVDSPRRIFGYTTRSQITGVRIGITLAGILIVRYWTMVFADAQNFAPYARMHAKPSDARDTILKKGNSVPLFGIYPLAKLRYTIPAIIALTALVAEFFVVAISGLPWRPGQLRGEYIFCGVACVVIATIMLVVQGLVFYWRSSLPYLPRRPDSVAAVMTYVAGTTMVAEFDVVSGMGKRSSRRAIKSMGRKYAYGLKMGEDGRQRWVVDEIGNGYEGSSEQVREKLA